MGSLVKTARVSLGGRLSSDSDLWQHLRLSLHAIDSKRFHCLQQQDRTMRCRRCGHGSHLQSADLTWP